MLNCIEKTYNVDFNFNSRHTGYHSHSKSHTPWSMVYGVSNDYLYKRWNKTLRQTTWVYDLIIFGRGLKRNKK